MSANEPLRPSRITLPMKAIFQATTLSVSLYLLACPGQLLAADKSKPNIVLIVADDLGYADVSFNPLAPKEVNTPHLHALAKEGVVCRQGYVSGHVCSPTRAGLMTGRYQQRLGLYTGGEAGSGLPMAEKIFPQYLKARGYTTGQLGKWHLGPTPEWSPALRGFDEVFGFLGRGAHDYFKLDDPADPIYRGTEVVSESGYLTGWARRPLPSSRDIRRSLFSCISPSMRFMHPFKHPPKKLQNSIQAMTTATHGSPWANAWTTPLAKLLTHSRAQGCGRIHCSFSSATTAVHWPNRPSTHPYGEASTRTTRAEFAFPSWFAGPVS